MAWSQGAFAASLPFMGLAEKNKVNPPKVVPGQLFPLAQRQDLNPPSQEDRSVERMNTGLQGIGIVQDMSRSGISTGNVDYLKQAEDIMFRANNISNQANATRLQRSMPIFRPTKTNPQFSSKSIGGGGGGGPKGKTELARFIRAISGKESGGNYGARNSSSGAMGKYQIMPANIAGPGGWDKQILGRNVTTQQFMSHPKIQEQIAQGMLTQYYNKYGAAGAASAWYSGSPTKWKTSYGGQGAYPSIHNYVVSILKAIR